MDKFDREIYVQKYYETKNNMIKNGTKEIERVYEENNDINLNKIIQGNPMKPKYTEKDIHDNKQLINKNKTKQNIIDAKDEKTNKKLDFFNQMIVKKSKNNKQIINNHKDEIRELFIKKKR